MSVPKQQQQQQSPPPPPLRKLVDEATIRDIFNKFDTNRDGILQRSELIAAIKKTGLPVSAATSSLAGKHDVTFPQFRNIILLQSESLNNSFNALDANGDGRISFEEFQSGLKAASPALAANMNNPHFVKLFNQLDLDNNQSIDFSEWIGALCLLPDTSLHAAVEHFQTQIFMDMGEVGGVRTASVSIGSPIDWHKAGKTLLAGGFSGAVSRTCTAPLDRLKTLLQIGEAGGGVVAGVRTIYTDGGVRAFWRGNGANVIKILPEAGLKFLSFEALKVRFTSDPAGGIQAHERFMAGASAGVITQTLIYPIETIKTRLTAAHAGEYRSILHCFQSTVAEGGVSMLFRGLVPSLIGIVPYAGIDLAACTEFGGAFGGGLSFLRETKALLADETLRSWYIRNYTAPDTQPSTGVTLACAATAGMSAQLVAYPLSFVRTNLQANTKYRNMLDCTVGVYKKSGFFGFYRGLLPNFVKTVPSACIGYTMYEKAKLFLDANWKRDSSAL